MNKLLVIVFDNESKAYEGSRALLQLHNDYSLTVYAYAVITKDSKGTVNIQKVDDHGPVGTGVGFATGALIGLLGGPVGLAIGAAAGLMTGSVYDLLQLGIDEDFVDEVSAFLLPGKSAVVADVDEEWVTPVDTRMEALGGVVFRRVRGEFIDAQIERGMAADRAELKQLEAEFDQAVGESKARLQARIDATKRRIQTRRDGIKEKIEAIKREEEAKINSLQEQAANARGHAKARLEKRIAETRADHEARVEKLSKAWQLVKDAAAI
jgi:uncharacterized membrane protein